MHLTSGDTIVYYGSIDAARGEGSYYGPCHCEKCIGRYLMGRPVTRHHLITAAGSIEHVRSVSFIPA